ncbi:MAG TPA: hypothetical protein VNA88_13690 [Candidatus Kapabacteria bacterium]|nr:hypothetical protein [Candidatus Kapabacteria bacterium]
MKRIALLAALVLIPVVAAAQESTIFSGDIDHGGYGGMVTKLTSINGELGVMMGGEGAWVIDHTAYLGFQGTGLVNRMDAKKLQTNGEPYVLRVNEFGLRAGYIHNSDDVLHLTAGTLIGGGSMLLSERFVWTDDSDVQWDTDQMYFLLEPEVAAELNVTKWMRVAATGSYRFAIGADYEGMTESDLSGPTGSLTLRFGWF